MNQFPPIPEELLKALATAFPDRIPDFDITEDEFRVKQGEQRVIRFLRAKHKEQQEKTPDVCIRQPQGS